MSNTAMSSQTIQRLSHLYNLALSLFGSDLAAERFMNTEHPELQNMTPFQAGLTIPGARAVELVIAKGKHGLPV